MLCVLASPPTSEVQMDVGLEEPWNEDLSNPESEAFTKLKEEVMQTMGFDRLEETMPGIPVKDVEVQFSISSPGLERNIFKTVATFIVALHADIGGPSLSDIGNSLVTAIVHLLPNSWTMQQQRMKFK